MKSIFRVSIGFSSSSTEYLFTPTTESSPDSALFESLYEFSAISLWRYPEVMAFRIPPADSILSKYL